MKIHLSPQYPPPKNVEQAHIVKLNYWGPNEGQKIMKIATGKKIRREVFKGTTTRLMHLFTGLLLIWPVSHSAMHDENIFITRCGGPLLPIIFNVDLELYFSPGTKKICSLNSIICPVTWLILLPTEFLSCSNNPPPAVNCNGEQQPVLLFSPPSHTYWVSGGRETLHLFRLWLSQDFVNFCPLLCHPTPSPLLFA